jgi:Holliday junction DNA helicase RuvA
MMRAISRLFMIYSLSGKLLHKKQHFIVVEVGGVGFRVTVPETVSQELPPVGGAVSLFTHMHVREDALDLYGFKTERELSLFTSLISISGIGPKSGINIMNVAQVDQLVAAINEGRTELLVKASGIGKKTAERVILELKGKLDFGGSSKTISLMEGDIDLEETLVGLGFTKQQAKATVSRIDPAIKGFNERLKEALKKKN